jgi:hypothetical protein
MVNDFDTELDSIFSEREARSANARRELARQTAATAAFAKAWDRLRTDVVVPVFNQAVSALGRRGVTADIGELNHGVGLYFHVNAVHSARGRRERDGQPYFGVLADASTQLVSFECNKSGVGRGDDIGDLPFSEVDADTVKARLLTLIRELLSDR